ncbi:hypothetical protein FHU35_111506 [Saccharopolyspora dendranthemae]|uniref:Uncharacterized protein n=1 Tax=Saccharopolyspora dendranthemae TaxID=1181886 RepID=A0A561VB95_9PSEU|nr:hypothetical protein FHU35_111506 [Saccharopolyspora dendranthemae]
MRYQRNFRRARAFATDPVVLPGVAVLLVLLLLGAEPATVVATALALPAVHATSARTSRTTHAACSAISIGSPGRTRTRS